MEDFVDLTILMRPICGIYMLLERVLFTNVLH